MQSIPEISQQLAEKKNSDIILYVGGTWEPSDDVLLQLLRRKSRRPNVLFLIDTYGGSPDVAYKVARHLRREYANGNFAFVVSGKCKSAGTLISLAANTIVMADNGELGPLDIQTRLKDDASDLGSGLTPIQALQLLRNQAGLAFDEQFDAMRRSPKFSFSPKLAGDIAAKMTIGLFRPIYAQLDPIRLGDNQRSMLVAHAYGLMLQSENVKPRTLVNLVSEYPSHGFVIDRQHACELFYNVRAPDDDEQALLDMLKDHIKTQRQRHLNGAETQVVILSDLASKPQSDGVEGNNENNEHTADNQLDSGSSEAADPSSTNASEPGNQGGNLAQQRSKSADATGLRQGEHSRSSPEQEQA